MKSRTFTDVIIAAVVFSTLFFLLLPFLNREREKSRRLVSVNRMGQIAAAFHQYADIYGVLPPAWTEAPTGERLHSWRVLLLPYLGEGELYRKIRLGEPWDSPWNSQFLADCPAIYACPDSIVPNASEGKDSTRRGLSVFSVVTGAGTLFPEQGGVRWEDITDGLSQTLLLMEIRRPVPWMSPFGDLSYETACGNFDAARFQGGVLIGLADGSVRFLDESADAKVRRRLLLRNDEEKFRRQ